MARCSKNLKEADMSLKVFLKNIYFLFICYAPGAVFGEFIFNYIIGRKRVKYKFSPQLRNFKKLCSSKNFSNDWFSGNIPYWLEIFNNHNFYEKKANILEIGSWEGMSSLFILTELSDATLTCVDTWSGSDEHQGSNVLNSIELNFDNNLSDVSSRYTKFKGTSYKFFNECPKDCLFDLVFIDGSHYCDDVLIDAVKGFQHLKPNGIIIFDDYFWKKYARNFDNPCIAVNSFLRLKKGLYRVISVYGQIAVQKTGEQSLVIEAA